MICNNCTSYLYVNGLLKSMVEKLIFTVIEYMLIIFLSTINLHYKTQTWFCFRRLKRSPIQVINSNLAGVGYMKYHGAIHKWIGIADNRIRAGRSVIQCRCSIRDWGAIEGLKNDLGFPFELTYTECEWGLPLLLILATRNEMNGVKSTQSSES